MRDTQEYYIFAQSFAAPFVSDDSEKYVEAEDEVEALTRFVDSYSHPMGLYSAVIYASHRDHVKRKKPLASWWSNHLIQLKLAMKKAGGCCSMRGGGPGVFSVNDEDFNVPNPKGGEFVDPENY